MRQNKVVNLNSNRKISLDNDTWISTTYESQPKKYFINPWVRNFHSSSDICPCVNLINEYLKEAPGKNKFSLVIQNSFNNRTLVLEKYFIKFVKKKIMKTPEFPWKSHPSETQLPC